MILRKLKIGARLALGFGAILAIMMVVSVGGTALGKKSRNDLVAVIDNADAKERLAAEMKALVLEQSAVMRNIGLHTDIKAMQIE
jgi:methyl-accepting chemotaxis protein